MAGLSDFRAQHPEYNDMSDTALADALHAKFYSDMPKADFDAKMGLASTAAPQPEPTLQQTLATSLPVRLARGAMDPIMGGIQAIAHGVSMLPGADPNVLPQIDQGLARGEQMYQADRKATGQTGVDLGRIAGSVLSPINYALPEVPGLGLFGRVVQGAAQGGALGGLQPVFDGNYADTKTKQVGIGAAAGGAAPLVSAGVKASAKLIPHFLGASTGTGANTVRGAFEAGKAGGEKGQAFLDAMSGDTPWEGVVADAKSALSTMKAQRNAAYRSGMADISKDASILDFQPIDDALSQANGVKTFKGRDLSKATADVRKEITDAITEWKGLDPAEYHTPEGIDALKQQIGDIRDNLQPGTPSRVIADQVYNGIRGTIAKQAPTYDKVMSDYAQASEQIGNVQRELSLGSKGNPGTALKKLQSVMRNNVNTNWGARTAMADKLSENAPNLLPQLAGMSANDIMPRGLARFYDAPVATMAGMANPWTLLGLPLASPRAVGNLAYGAGALSRGATTLGNLPVIQALPKLPIGALGAAAPNLLINPAVQGAQ